MWEYEYTVETTTDQAQLWRCWSEVELWPRWNDGIASITVDGPFAVGMRFVMTPPDSEPVSMQIVEIEDGLSFVDEMDAGDFVVRTIHRLQPHSGGTLVTYRTEITGPLADSVGPVLGPEITADFPDVIAALVKRAEG
jgi:uncharacterized protein YndB with AHSA1/START domain